MTISQDAQLRILIHEICELPESHAHVDRKLMIAARKMRKIGIASRVDDSSASIGKKYARNDELGTPFGCTVDFASLSKGTMTLR